MEGSDYLIIYLKPKVSGYSANNRFRSVLLPEPDGPQMTRGRGPCLTIVAMAVSGKEWGLVILNMWEEGMS